MNTRQKEIIEQIRAALGASEDTEHLIDWLRDLWTTFDILIDRFGAARAIQIVIAADAVPPTRTYEVRLT